MTARFTVVIAGDGETTAHGLFDTMEEAVDFAALVEAKLAGVADVVLVDVVPIGEASVSEATADWNPTPPYRAQLDKVAAAIGGQVVNMGGDNLAVEFDRVGRAAYLATLDDDDLWIVSYEVDDEDGHREWVDIDIAGDVDVVSAIRAAMEQARRQPLI